MVFGAEAAGLSAGPESDQAELVPFWIIHDAPAGVFVLERPFQPRPTMRCDVGNRGVKVLDAQVEMHPVLYRTRLFDLLNAEFCSPSRRSKEAGLLFCERGLEAKEPAPELLGHLDVGAVQGRLPDLRWRAHGVATSIA